MTPPASDMATQPRKPGLLYRLLTVFFIITAISGLLRVLGVFQQRDILLDFGLPAGLSWYLFAAGLALFLCNLSALLLGRFKPAWRLGSAWGAVLCSAGLYWIERLFLWSSDQPRTNLFFMLGYHLVILGILAAYTRVERKQRGS